MTREHPGAAQHRETQQLSHVEHSHARPLPADWPIRTMAGHHFVRPGRCPDGAGSRRFHRCSPTVQSRRAACAAIGR